MAADAIGWQRAIGIAGGNPDDYFTNFLFEDTPFFFNAGVAYTEMSIPLTASTEMAAPMTSWVEMNL